MRKIQSQPDKRVWNGYLSIFFPHWYVYPFFAKQSKTKQRKIQLLKQTFFSHLFPNMLINIIHSKKGGKRTSSHGYFIKILESFIKQPLLETIKWNKTYFWGCQQVDPWLCGKYSLWEGAFALMSVPGVARLPRPPQRRLLAARGEGDDIASNNQTEV